MSVKMIGWEGCAAGRHRYSKHPGIWGFKKEKKVERPETEAGRRRGKDLL